MKQPLSEKLLGYFLLMPAIISVTAFICSDFLDIGGNSSIMTDITYENHSGLAIFIGLLTLASVYLIKANIRYDSRTSIGNPIAFLANSEPPAEIQSETKDVNIEIPNKPIDENQNRGMVN